MFKRSVRPPSYRLHKPSGRAVVTFGRRDFYLGVFGSEESRREYDRLVAEWLANGRRTAADDPITVDGLICQYLERQVDVGYASNEPESIRAALKPVHQLYGHVAAASFGPKALKAVRKAFIDAGYVRTQVNKRTRMVVRMFKFGVAEELIPPSTWEALRAVEGVRRGTPGLKESRPVRPVDDAHVDAVLPYLSRQVRAMVELQRLTGARSGEICIMRTRDVAIDGDVWTYRPSTHKTEHHGRDRVIHLGPKARAVLAPWLKPDDPEAYLFQPREARGDRMRALRAARKSKVQPSQVDRSKADPQWSPGEAYTPTSYRGAIAYAVVKANAARLKADPDAEPIPHWHPHQLRHTAATALRSAFDLDVARAVLGHTSVAVTEIYAEADLRKAREAMERVG
ncbi:MAG: hypothetical protein BGO49_21420 [Planctomycetales bacterium 71-10]|nr:MAG: hypothetical protein BGO49_21420 [Planctomycetales bacterium 71-10]